MDPVQKKPRDLRKGDIIRMRIPFEENTPDYYNGHSPKKVRGGLYTDRFGNSSKPRFVVVIGNEGNNIIYLPLTSRHSGFDSQHQYMLQDNSMTWKRDEDMKSYVECHALRAIYANPNWDIQSFGHVAENDMVNIMVKAGKRSIDFDSQRDQRTYVSRVKNEQFEKQLESQGFVLKKDPSGNSYNEEVKGNVYVHPDGRTVSKQKWGLVKYHVPLSIEEVTKMVAARESKPVDEFTKAVADITEKTANRESEATK